MQRMHYFMNKSPDIHPNYLICILQTIHTFLKHGNVTLEKHQFCSFFLTDWVIYINKNVTAGGRQYQWGGWSVYVKFLENSAKGTGTYLAQM